MTKLIRAYQSGSIRAILKATKRAKVKEPEPYCEEDFVCVMQDKYPVMKELVKTMDLET